VNGGDDPSFAGHTVWVTGAARGQGACHVQRFAAAGARVGCVDTDEAGLGRLAGRLRGDGRTVATACADVSDWDAMTAAAASFRSTLGDVNVVVANAGIVGELAPIESLDVTAWRRVLDVNLTGAFQTLKAAIPQLRQHSHSSVVIVASAASFFAHPRYAAYSASKHGMIGLLRAAANELGSAGIRVNAVCPGWVDTPMLDHEAAAAGIPREQAVSEWVQEHILERLVTPDEVSDAVLWLSSAAARMITGVALPVDGGEIARRGDSVAHRAEAPRGGS
jgi:NAD(P)-dependent dehydrogenase (short-subunit alcohol dehydrogenase family)